MDTEDTQLLIDEVGRFSHGRIAELTARPELPIDANQLHQLTLEAQSLGILAQAATDDGYSIWEQTNDANMMRFNTSALRSIAGASAGIAMRWHRLGLAKFVATELGLTLSDTELIGTVLAPTGHYGLARTSLSKYLQRAPLGAGDLDLLSDWFDRQANATTVYAQAEWSHMLWPVWSQGEIAWQQLERSDMLTAPDLPQHGLDELRGFRCSAAPSAGKLIELESAQARRIYQRVLKLDMLGLLAIGAGTLDRARSYAYEYAAVRKQGGGYISQHPAVQHMLSEIDMALSSVDQALAVFSLALDQLDLGKVAATRAAIAPALCHAASQALQVHGGIGYMRDAGPEKVLRDQNILKLIAGGVTDIRNFIAGWNGVAL